MELVQQIFVIFIFILMVFIVIKMVFHYLRTKFIISLILAIHFVLIGFLLAIFIVINSDSNLQQSTMDIYLTVTPYIISIIICLIIYILDVPKSYSINSGGISLMGFSFLFSGILSMIEWYSLSNNSNGYWIINLNTTVKVIASIYFIFFMLYYVKRYLELSRTKKRLQIKNNYRKKILKLVNYIVFTLGFFSIYLIISNLLNWGILLIIFTYLLFFIKYIFHPSTFLLSDSYIEELIFLRKDSNTYLFSLNNRDWQNMQYFGAMDILKEISNANTIPYKLEFHDKIIMIESVKFEIFDIYGILISNKFTVGINNSLKLALNQLSTRLLSLKKGNITCDREEVRNMVTKVFDYII